MKLFEIRDKKFGKAFDRISNALILNTPGWIEWVSDIKDADLIVIHTVGGDQVEELYSLDISKVVNIQHCVFTTSVPLSTWEEIWNRAFLNVSFHDLASYTELPINTIRIPWGADTNVFVNKNLPRSIDVFATGHVAETECLDLVHDACRLTNSIMYHTGENLRYTGPNYRYLQYMDDNDLVTKLSTSRFTSCLRNVEGFELMGIEGALCGAVPIVPKLPTYDWYEGFGEFVNMSDDITGQIVRLLEGNYFMTQEKIDYVMDKFSWKKICRDFYGAIK